MERKFSKKINVICNSWRKKKCNRGKSKVSNTNCWKRKFIFFDLEYWKYLHVHHNLNVMHTLMQQLLPVSLRYIFPKHVTNSFCRLSSFFNALCSKVVDVPTLDELQKVVVVTLCLFEKYFPPSLFDIMVHLVKEVRLGGPVYLKWIYPFERFMKVLKGYV